MRKGVNSSTKVSCISNTAIHDIEEQHAINKAVLSAHALRHSVILFFSSPTDKRKPRELQGPPLYSLKEMESF